MKKKFDRFSHVVTKATGSSYAFLIATLILIIWAVSGPYFRFSDTWQLVINTGTTCVTFLMVFLIQQAQNKDTTAIHLKLNELIAANKFASNRLVSIEDFTEKELDTIKKFYTKLAELAKTDHDFFAAHSFDEATKNHSIKIKKE
jgi:low affinity Fe/Cu permease